MKLVIHIGQPKTASTTLQRHLKAQRWALARQGIWYSSAFGLGKARAATDVFKNERSLKRSPIIISDFREELRDPYRTMIVSNENFYKMGPEQVARFRDACDGFDGEIAVHCYLRNPAEHFPSAYQQKIRGYKVESPDEYLEDRISTGYYSYYSVLKRWEAAFGAGRIHARLFDRRIMKPTPTEDFLHWIGHPEVELPPPTDDVTNTSIDPVATDAIRYFSRFHVDHPHLASEHQTVVFRDAMIEQSTHVRARVCPRQAARLAEAVGDELRQAAAAFLTPTEAAYLLEPVVGIAAPLPDFETIIRRTADAMKAPVHHEQLSDTSTMNDNARYRRFVDFVQQALATNPKFGADVAIREQPLEKIKKRRKRYA